MMKYEYRNSGIDWIGDIPKHWKVRKLKVIGEAIIGLTYSPNDVTDEQDGTLVLRSSNIQNGKYSIEDCVFVKSDAPKKLITKKGDILLCARNGSADLVGKNIMIDEQTEGKTFGAFMTVFRSPHNDYLRFFFNSELFKSQSGSFSTSTINQLTHRILMNMQITSPPKSEQIAIANYLDNACSDIDRVVEIKRKQIENLQQQLKSIIHHTTTKGLNPKAEMEESGIDWIGEVPRTWKRRRIKDIVHLQSGDNIVSEQINDNDEFPVFGGNGLRGYYSAYTHEGEFVLIGRQGALCGNINYATGKFWASEHAVVATPIKKVSTLWLGEILKTMNLYQYSNSAAQPGLSVEKIKNLYFIVPPFEVQIEIAKFIENYSHTNISIQSKIEKQIEVLLNYKKSLIHEVVTGKKQVYGLT